MKKAKDFRAQAWCALKGKWGTVALCYLIYFFITCTVSSIGVIPYVGNVLGGVVSMVISGPFSLGLTILSLKVIRGEGPDVNNLFDGFKRFVDSFLAGLICSILIALWSLLLVVPGIIKALSYSMTFYILADDPNITANEARKRSMELMHGNKWRLFCLNLSFIGWGILCILTLGILWFWVAPYQQAALAAFYGEISAQNQDVSDDE